MANNGTERCVICQEDKVPGPPLVEQVIEYNQIFHWTNVCPPCRDLCISRTQFAYFQIIDEILELLDKMQDADDTNIIAYEWYEQQCQFLILTLNNIKNWN